MVTAEKHNALKDVSLEVRPAGRKGRGVFTRAPIKAGTLVSYLTGFVLPTHRLRADYMALQIDSDMWLCSKGGRLDDNINHSCNPTTGFTCGGLKLHSLRDIERGEEITFDYSTSLTDDEWSLECACGESHCRKTVLPFQQNGEAYRRRNLPIALDYIRKLHPISNRSSYAQA